MTYFFLGHRGQLAGWEAQPPANQLPQREQQGRVLPPVWRHQDCLWPERQHHQNVGQTGIRTWPVFSKSTFYQLIRKILTIAFSRRCSNTRESSLVTLAPFSACNMTRRWLLLIHFAFFIVFVTGDHFWVFGQHSTGLGRWEWRDGEHADPPLRGGAPSQFQLQSKTSCDFCHLDIFSHAFLFQYSQFCNGMMVTCSKDRSIAVRKTEQSWNNSHTATPQYSQHFLQSLLFSGVGHGESDRDQPEESAGWAPSGCERRWLRRQIHCLCQRGQNHQGFNLKKLKWCCSRYPASRCGQRAPASSCEPWTDTREALLACNTMTGDCHGHFRAPWQHDRLQAGGLWEFWQHNPIVGHWVWSLSQNPGGSRGAGSLH